MKPIFQNRIIKVTMVPLIMLMFSVAFTFATPFHKQESALRILLPANGNHTVVVDNTPYHGIYTSFRTENLRPGNHRIKIVQTRIIHRGRTQITHKNVLYNGVIFVPANSIVLASVNYNGRLVIDRICRTNARDGYRNNGGYNGYDQDKNDDYTYRRGHDENTQDESYEDAGDTYDRRDQNDRQKYRDDNVRENDQRVSFRNTLQVIKNQSFDSERLKIAKHAAANGELTSHEVSEIAKLFSFESTRLDFAKYAYDYTIDKKNYVVVHQVFQFSSSVSQLQDYISQR